MPHTLRTIELNDNWDISLTESGKIPIRRNEIATAQNVANEIRRFLRDTYFDYNVGIPHFQIELGHPVPESILRAAIRAATLRVESVSDIIEINLENFDRETRTLSGEVTFRANNGAVETIEF